MYEHFTYHGWRSENNLSEFRFFFSPCGSWEWSCYLLSHVTGPRPNTFPGHHYVMINYVATIITSTVLFCISFTMGKILCYLCWSMETLVIWSPYMLYYFSLVITSLWHHQSTKLIYWNDSKVRHSAFSLIREST